MIENNSQRRAATSWIAYWKGSVSAGEQSWLGGEQALGEIMGMHQQVDEYDQRVASRQVALESSPAID